MKRPRALVSLVIPIYNVEAELASCLDSIAAQSYTNIEVVLVDDGSTDDSRRIAESYTERDPRFVLKVKPNGGLGSARNYGTGFVSGTYLGFVDSDDVLPPTAVERLAQSLERSGSDFVVGSFVRVDGSKRWEPRWTRRFHQEERIGITVSDMPGVLQNVFAWGKLFRTSYYQRVVHPFPEGVRYEDQEPTARAYLAARAFDVIPDIVYEWHTRSTSISQQKWLTGDVRDRFFVWREVLTFLERSAPAPVLEEWITRVFSEDLPQYFEQLPRAEQEYHEAFRALLADFWDLVPVDLRPRVDLHSRQMIEAVLRNRIDLVEAILGDLAEYGPHFQVVRQASELIGLPMYAHLLPSDWVGVDLRVSEDQLVALGRFRGMEWIDSDHVLVRGHAYIKNTSPSASQVRLASVDLASEAPIGEFEVKFESPDPHLNEEIRDGAHDHEASGFTAIVELPDAKGPVRVEATVESEGLRRDARLTTRVHDGAAAVLTPGPVNEGHRWVPHWDSIHGVTFDRLQLSHVADNVTVTGRVLSIRVQQLAGELGMLRVDCPERRIRTHTPPSHVAGGSSAMYTVELPAAGTARVPQHGVRWTVSVEVSGSYEALQVSLPHPLTSGDNSPFHLGVSERGALSVLELDNRVDATSISFDDSGLLITGQMSESAGRPRLVLSGAHGTIAGEVLEWDTNHGYFAALFPADLIHGAGDPTRSWGLLHLSPESRDMNLAGAELVRWAEGADRQTPALWVGRQGRVRLSRTSRGQVWVRREAPLALGMRSPFTQRRALSDAIGQRTYPTAGGARETWLFESWGGRYCTDSGSAIHRELRSRGHDVEIYWSVRDSTVKVPTGATALLRDSADYIRVLHSADVLVNNANFPHYFRKQPHQFYLQTWHGTPLKRIGRDMPTQNLSLSYRALMKREGAAWDLLLAQNEFAAGVLPAALESAAETLVVGYPRNDTLQSSDSEQDVGREVRASLGILDGRQVVLYMPTWRDTERTAGGYRLVQHLDYGWASAQLRDDVVFLVRGHSNTRHADPLRASNAVDVSYYPEVNDLIAAADVLITDYSSVMFDFAVTGKPMAFLVPDLREYRDETRGFYLELSEIAPGPLLQDTDEVVQWLRQSRNADNRQPGYAEFVERFAPYDDGAAAGRVIDGLLGVRASRTPKGP